MAHSFVPLTVSIKCRVGAALRIPYPWGFITPQRAQRQPRLACEAPAMCQAGARPAGSEGLPLQDAKGSRTQSMPTCSYY